MSNAHPRRVLYVENGIGYGGAVICLRHLVRNLDRSKYIPLVVTGRNSSEYSAIADDAPWKPIRDQIWNVSKAKSIVSSTPWIQKVPGLQTLLNQFLARADDVINFVPFFIRLLWTARRFDVDLVHANNEPLCNRAALLVGKVLRVPVICHVRGRQNGSMMMRWLFKIPRHFVSVSRWIAEGIKAVGVSTEKITVVYDGIALDQLDIHADGSKFRREHDIPGDAFAVGLVGLLIPWKGQELFLDTAHILRASIPNLTMLIVGGTPDECVEFERHLKKRVEREQLEDLVSFTGHVSPMEPVYNGLDVVVSASTSPEPLGTVVIEAMAMGRMLVAPDFGGAAEMAENNKHALLFKPKDATSLSAAIIKAYQHPELTASLAAAARQKALSTFSVEEHVNKVQNLYDRALTGKYPRIEQI